MRAGRTRLLAAAGGSGFAVVLAAVSFASCRADGPAGLSAALATLPAAGTATTVSGKPSAGSRSTTSSPASLSTVTPSTVTTATGPTAIATTPAPSEGASVRSAAPPFPLPHAAGELWVGPGEAYSRITDAVAAAPAGATIKIRSGVYPDDTATIDRPMTLVGVGGQAELRATGPIGNGKALLVTNADVTVDNLAFTGASVADQNGAGIRQQRGDLTVRNSLFQGNENGILTAADPQTSILIENCDFADNGRGDGYTHALYVGAVARLEVRDSRFTGTKVGHAVKSRAHESLIRDNRLDDGVDGSTTSYAIDLPNGGGATVTGNVIRQGTATENPAMISYGAEGNLHPGGSLTVSGNSFADERPGASVAVANHTAVGAVLDGNTFEGFDGQDVVLSGPGAVTG